MNWLIRSSIIIIICQLANVFRSCRSDFLSLCLLLSTFAVAIFESDGISFEVASSSLLSSPWINRCADVVGLELCIEYSIVIQFVSATTNQIKCTAGSLQCIAFCSGHSVGTDYFTSTTELIRQINKEAGPHLLFNCRCCWFRPVSFFGWFRDSLIMGSWTHEFPSAIYRFNCNSSSGTS